MRRLAAAAASIPLVLAGCSGASAATRGYQVTDFTTLRVAGPFTVRVHTGGAPMVRATGPQAKIDRLAVEQHGDVLEIKPVRTQGWGQALEWSKDELVVEVSVHALAAASLTGSGDVTIDRARGDALALGLSGSGDLAAGDVQVRQLKLAATGSGDLTAAGRTQTVAATLNGSGDVHGDKLLADTASVNLVGSGDVAIGARRSAAVSIAGSGDVTVTGGARCTVTRAGSGDVSCAGGGATTED